MYLTDFRIASESHDTQYNTFDVTDDSSSILKSTKYINAINEYGFAKAFYNSETDELISVQIKDMLNRYPEYAWFKDKQENSSGKLAVTDCVDDILDKVAAIMNNRIFDTKIVLSVELPSSIVKKIRDKAFAEKITLDEFICNSISDYAKQVISAHNKS